MKTVIMVDSIISAHHMTLKNKRGVEFLLNVVSGEDAAQGTIDCLTAVYGGADNYAIPYMLDDGWLLDKIGSDSIYTYCVLTEDGTAAATLSAFRNQRFNGLIDISSLAVHPDYTGLGLGSAITGYMMEDLQQMGHTRFFSPIVMHHPLSGRIYEDHGYVPTGFFFGDCDADKHLSELSLNSQKASVAVYMKNGEIGRTAEVFLPALLEPLAMEVYRSLGVSPIIHTQSQQQPLDNKCQLECHQVEHHKALYTYIYKCSTDLAARIIDLENQFSDVLQTYYACLSIKDPSVIRGYEILRQMGYKFAGFWPLCGDNEFVIMYNTGRVAMDYSELKMSDALGSLYERIVAL